MCAKIDARCGIVNDNSNNSIHNAELHMIHTDIKKLMALQQHTVIAAQQASSETVIERIIEREITRNNASQSVIEQDTSVTAEKSVSKTEYRKKFKRELTLLLRRLFNHDYKSTQINRLLDLINKWYVKRFCTDYRENGFKLYTYGIGQITKGIYTLIAEYAKSVATNSAHEFFVNFNTWLDTLGYKFLMLNAFICDCNHSLSRVWDYRILLKISPYTSDFFRLSQQSE